MPSSPSPDLSLRACLGLQTQQWQLNMRVAQKNGVLSIEYKVVELRV
jgi:hypothetical protein